MDAQEKLRALVPANVSQSAASGRAGQASDRHPRRRSGGAGRRDAPQRSAALRAVPFSWCQVVPGLDDGSAPHQPRLAALKAQGAPPHLTARPRPPMGLGRSHTNAAPPPARPRGEDPPPYTSRYLTEETQYNLAPVSARVQKVGLAWAPCSPRAHLQSLVQASLAPLCQPGAFRCPWRNSQRSSPPAAHSHRPGLGAQQRHLRPRGQPQPERGLARVGLRAAAQRGGQGLLRAVAGAPPGFRRPVHAGPRDRGRACLRRPITLMTAGCSGSCCWRLF